MEKCWRGSGSRGGSLEVRSRIQRCMPQYRHPISLGDKFDDKVSVQEPIGRLSRHDIYLVLRCCMVHSRLSTSAKTSGFYGWIENERSRSCTEYAVVVRDGSSGEDLTRFLHGLSPNVRL